MTDLDIQFTAKDLFRSDDIDMDALPKVDRRSDGSWVDARVWVPNSKVRPCGMVITENGFIAMEAK